MVMSVEVTPASVESITPRALEIPPVSSYEYEPPV
jgi:hypothetical protein